MEIKDNKMQVCPQCLGDGMTHTLQHICYTTDRAVGSLDHTYGVIGILHSLAQPF